MRSEQSIDGRLREQPAGVAQVRLQIGVVGTVRKGRAEAGDCFVQLAGFDLCNSQGIQCAYTLKMRNSFGGITLLQQRITQKLVSDHEIGTDFKSAIKRRDGYSRIALYDVSVAEIDECVGQPWVRLSCLAKLC